MTAQSERIARMLNQDLGTATITHPFHPLKGKTFTILKIRKYPNERFFSLLANNDVFCVPEAWIIFREENHPDSPFNAGVLRSLLDFSRNHKKSIDNDLKQ